MKAQTARWPEPKFGPRSPLKEGIHYRVKSDYDGILLKAYAGTKLIGNVLAHWGRSAQECQADVDVLKEQFPELAKNRILAVWKTALDERWHNQGIGKGMYEALMVEAFQKEGPFLFVPTVCTLGSGTSPEAKRVWASLARRYPSSGTVVAVTRRPVLPAEVKVASDTEADLIDFPGTRQATEYSCGPSVVQAVLHYYGIEFREDELAAALGTDSDSGTSHEALINCFESSGLQIYAGTMNVRQVQDWIRQKVPVILNIQAWSEAPDPNYSTSVQNGHYVVAIGFDDQGMIFDDPSILGNLGYLPYAHLLERWRDSDNGRVTERFGIAVWGKPPMFDSSKLVYIASTPMFGPETDRKGQPLAPGDYVSAPKYPKGTIRGWVTISKRQKVYWTDPSTGKDVMVPALALIDEEGTTYNLPASKSLKLPPKSPPSNIKVAGYMEEVRKRQAEKVHQMNPKPGQYANLLSWFGDVWAEIKQVFPQSDSMSGAMTIYQAERPRGNEYVSFSEVRMVVPRLPPNARIVNTKDGLFGGRKGQPLSNLRVARNQKIIEAPHHFHPVKVEEPKAERKEYPFQGYIDFQGLQIDVENLAGSTRSGEDPNTGATWSNYMHHHYGEIRGTEGTDGDKLDVYVGPNHDSSVVVVIHQMVPDTGQFDEDKVMLGFDSVEEAIGAYKKQYDRPGFYRDGEYVAMPIGAFWRWVHEKNNQGKKVKLAARRIASLYLSRSR